MILLKTLRVSFGLTHKQIINLIHNRNVPTNWSPYKIDDLCRKLREWEECEELAQDIKEHNNISYCDDCEAVEFSSDLRSCYEGDKYVCGQCCDDGYSWSDCRDTYISHNDYEEEEDHREQNEESGLWEYDHNVLDEINYKKLSTDRGKQKDILYYGIELEVEKRRDCPYDIANHIQNKILNDFAICKQDGSLDGGFEICTAPSTFKFHLKEWEKFFKDKLCMNSLKGWNTDTAGIHIHISRSPLSPATIGKILVFVNDDINTSFIRDIAGRTSDQWAKRSNKKISDCIRSSDKYEAINMSHLHTIELRIFKSNVARHGFFRVLEFTDALVHFARDYGGLTTMSLHYKSFLRYMEQPIIKAHYPHLTAWLIRKGYINGRPSRKVGLQDEEQLDTATN